MLHEMVQHAGHEVSEIALAIASASTTVETQKTGRLINRPRCNGWKPVRLSSAGEHSMIAQDSDWGPFWRGNQGRVPP